MMDGEPTSEIDRTAYSQQADDYQQIQSHLIDTTIDSQGVGTVEEGKQQNFLHQDQEVKLTSSTG